MCSPGAFIISRGFDFTLARRFANMVTTEITLWIMVDRIWNESLAPCRRDTASLLRPQNPVMRFIDLDLKRHRNAAVHPAVVRRLART